MTTGGPAKGGSLLRFLALFGEGVDGGRPRFRGTTVLMLSGSSATDTLLTTGSTLIGFLERVGLGEADATTAFGGRPRRFFATGDAVALAAFVLASLSASRSCDS